MAPLRNSSSKKIENHWFNSLFSVHYMLFYCIDVCVCVYLQLDVKSRHTKIHKLSVSSDDSEESFRTVLQRKVCLFLPRTYSSCSYFRLLSFFPSSTLCFFYFVYRLMGFTYFICRQALLSSHSFIVIAVWCNQAYGFLTTHMSVSVSLSLSQAIVCLSVRPRWLTQRQSILMHVMSLCARALRRCPMSPVWVMDPVIQSLTRLMVSKNAMCVCVYIYIYTIIQRFGFSWRNSYFLFSRDAINCQKWR